MVYGTRWFHNAQNAAQHAQNAQKNAQGSPAGPSAPQDGPDEAGGEVSLSELVRTSMQRAAEAARPAETVQAAETAEEDVPLPTVGEEETPVESLTEGSDLSALVRQWVANRTDVGRSGGADGDVLHLVPTSPDQDASEGPGRSVDGESEVSRAALPRRSRGVPRATPVRRMGVLIDAHTTLPDSVDGLFDALVDQGTVSVSRAYGDWSPVGSQEWMPRLRHHAIQPVHHFPAEHDQRSMVAMTIDAVDLARDSAVDVVVLVGDLAWCHPLLQRLNACGIPVLAFGPTETPYDVRAQCEEFVDLGFLDARGTVGAGRHRA